MLAQFSLAAAAQYVRYVLTRVMFAGGMPKGQLCTKTETANVSRLIHVSEAETHKSRRRYAMER